MLLAIDPGADAGWAQFHDGKLVACGLNEGAMRAGVTRVVIERPTIYPGGRQKARPADIITLAVRAGEWGGRAEAFFGVTPEYVEPRTWKGHVPKDVHHARILRKLVASEHDVLAMAVAGAPGKRALAESKRHNVLDAIGIGLWAVKR